MIFTLCNMMATTPAFLWVQFTCAINSFISFHWWPMDQVLDKIKRCMRHRPHPSGVHSAGVGQIFRFFLDFHQRDILPGARWISNAGNRFSCSRGCWKWPLKLFTSLRVYNPTNPVTSLWRSNCLYSLQFSNTSTAIISIRFSGRALTSNILL